MDNGREEGVGLNGRPIQAFAGRKFGRLTAVYSLGIRKRYTWWHCLCDCGKEHDVRGSRLLSGNTVSCGCYRSELTSKRVKGGIPFSRTHGATVGEKHTPEYNTWYAMKQRTGYSRNQNYRYYGGRGITICERWKKFENFLADMGKKPSPKHSIDRINSDGNYEPGNCRWATQSEQVRNRRPTVRRKKAA